MTPHRHDRTPGFLRHVLAIASLLCIAACGGGGNESPAADAQALSAKPQGDAVRPLADAVVLPAVPGSGPAGAAALPDGMWLKGDLHVHDDHSSDGSAPRQLNDDRAKGNTGIADQIGQATLMGLQYLALTDHRTYDQHYDPAWESSSLLLIRGEEANGSPHANVLGGVDTVVQGGARADRAAFAHVQQSLWNAHSQGAAWQVNHPEDGETNADGSPNVYANVQGMDLVETWNHAPDEQLAYAENRWNAGFRFGMAGASDSHMRELWDGEGMLQIKLQ